MVLLISKPRIRQNFPISHRQCWTRMWGEEPASGGADKLVSQGVNILRFQFFPNFQAGKSFYVPKWRGARNALKENLSSRKSGVRAILPLMATLVFDFAIQEESAGGDL